MELFFILPIANGTNLSQSSPLKKINLLTPTSPFWELLPAFVYDIPPPTLQEHMTQVCQSDCISSLAQSGGGLAHVLMRRVVLFLHWCGGFRDHAMETCSGLREPIREENHLSQGNRVLAKLTSPSRQPGGSEGKEPAASQEIGIGSLGWQDPLEKEMATLSSILAWRMPWTEEPAGYIQYMGL